MVTLVPISNAQILNEEKSVQSAVIVNINSNGNVHVTHIVHPSNSPKQMELVPGTISNLTVKDPNGKEKDFTTIAAKNNSLLIHPSEEDSIVEYNLENVLSEINNVWTWEFRYLESTIFMLPKEVELAFANERPVYLGDKNGLKCHGCQMTLEYSINEPKRVEKIKLENKEFLVEVRSHLNIDEIGFDWLTESIMFDVDIENSFVTIIIPSELLDEPYNVFLNDEKIFFHQFIKNGTHVWLNMKAVNPGEIRIEGTGGIPENGNNDTGGIPENIIIIVGIIGILIILVVLWKRKFNHR